MKGAREFEVRCPTCDVSFPTGTRQCFHCGGRLGKGAFRVSSAPLEHAGPEMLGEDFSQSPVDVVDNPILSEGEEEPKRGPRGRLNAGISLVWILMAVVFSLMRACGGE